MSNTTKSIIELRNVSKFFPGTIALDKMNLIIKSGEIHGLIGENGAGKSTLIKIITGAYKIDEGEILVCNEKINDYTISKSKKIGIACVYQELNIEKYLSITDNIFLNNWKRKGLLLDYDYMNKKSKEVLSDLGIDIDVTKAAGSYSLGVLQLVEIARAIVSDVKLIIMDEPTSSFGENEIKQLFAVCNKLKNDGIGIIFVSHKLDELFAICDKVTVMRDGKLIKTSEIENWNYDRLITSMVGEKIDKKFPKIDIKKGECVFEVKNFTADGIFYDMSFKAYANQILGVFGLVGAGRTQLAKAIFGANSFTDGEIFIHNKKVDINKPQDAINNGIALLTEDRNDTGLVLDQSIKTNLIMSNFSKFTRGMLFDEKNIENNAVESISKLKIKSTSIEQIVRQLSGGNRQKVVIGKWINSDADIYIFDEPTRGIDVGAKIEVYKVMNELVSIGKCIIMISSELDEVMGMSDEIIVMRDGVKTAIFDRKSIHFNREDIMKAAWGTKFDD